jgi:hypothetical protein
MIQWKHFNTVKVVIIRPYWYNYRTNVSSVDQPAEVPDDIARDIMRDNGTFYHNTATNESTWENPFDTSWRRISSSKGELFWFNAVVCVRILRSIYVHKMHARTSPW